MRVLEHSLVRNRALCDGTPRRETGYRRVLRLAHQGRTWHLTSPLMKDRGTASRWLPSYRQYRMEKMT